MTARIAQLAEQDTLNVKVPSSILGAGTKSVRLMHRKAHNFKRIAKKNKTQYTIRTAQYEKLYFE